VGGAAGGRRGALQLWQFLVSLLAEGARCVAWTGRGLEFKLHEPEEVSAPCLCLYPHTDHYTYQ
jgi:hypothetical protein